ncbi:MAG: 3-hydroxyacyl-CoA dehydrogenase NAD-binding domain-containing protein [Acetobacterales bacterium]
MAQEHVAIVGAGLIGAGWCAGFLARGYDVTAWDADPGFAPRLRRFVDSAWPALEKLGLQDGASPRRLRTLDTLSEALAGATFVQESAPDRLEVKRALYAEIDLLLDPAIVVSSSSTALLMTDMQQGLPHAARYVLGHPLNPPHIIPLVEVSGGRETAAWALDRAIGFYRAAGKHPIRLNREVQGHVAGRLGAAIYREAVHLAVSGVASVADIDAALSEGLGLRFAVHGPHLSYHLGGGEGGLRHYLEHLGPAQERRWADLGAPRLTPDVVETLVDGVEEEAAGRGVSELERQRDAALTDILAARRRSPR